MNIKIRFTDGRIGFFQTFLPDELKQQLLNKNNNHDNQNRTQSTRKS